MRANAFEVASARRASYFHTLRIQGFSVARSLFSSINEAFDGWRGRVQPEYTAATKRDNDITTYIDRFSRYVKVKSLKRFVAPRASELCSRCNRVSHVSLFRGDQFIIAITSLERNNANNESVYNRAAAVPIRKIRGLFLAIRTRHC